MGIDSLLRKAEHKALSDVSVSGKILDLGGDRRSTYRAYLNGEAEYTLVNLSQESDPDILHDLEQPLPMADAMYDGVLLINVLEHIYECRQLISESVRVLVPGGNIIIVVPFLFPVHPSPNDYWRFTDKTLTHILTEAGCVDIHIKALGSGVLAARYVMLDRLLPNPLRVLNSLLLAPSVVFFDSVFTRVAIFLGKKYQASDYALGYLVSARFPGMN